jgi:hypothetical protein
MVYNELLIVLMAFLAVLMIVMTIIVLTRPRKPPVIKEKEEPVEKILVERGFEREIQEESLDLEKEETDSGYTPVFIEAEPEKPEYDELHSEYIDKIEPSILDETEPAYQEPVNDYKKEVDLLERARKLTHEAMQEEKPLVKKQPEEEPLENQIQEDEEIKSIVEDIDEPETSEYVDFRTPVSEPGEEVIITPTKTFYDAIPEKGEEDKMPTLEGSPTLDEESPELEVEVYEEGEFDQIEKFDLGLAEEQVERELEEAMPAVEPVEITETEYRRRIRKPVIDENDENIKVDLGIETCPHCGSKVPDTIYCINCGKPLNPEKVEEEDEV